MPARISCINGVHTFSCTGDTQHQIRIIVDVYIFNEFSRNTDTLALCVVCSAVGFCQKTCNIHMDSIYKPFGYEVELIIV